MASRTPGGRSRSVHGASTGLAMAAAVAWNIVGCGDSFTAASQGADAGGNSQGSSAGQGGAAGQGGSAGQDRDGGASGGGGGVPGTGGSATGGGGGGCSADLSVDPENCGVCGHSCLLGACEAGTCQSFEVAASQTGDVVGVAIAPAGVYWTRGRDLWTAPFGGEAVLVQVGNGERNHITYGDNGSLYWTSVPGAIVTCPVPCATPMIAHSVAGAIEGIAFQGGEIFWTEFVANGCVMARNLASNTDRTIGCGYQLPEEVAVDGTSVYWTERGAQSVWSSSGDQTPQEFATEQNGPAGIAIDDVHVYWGNQEGAGTIMRKRRDGTTEIEQVTVSPGGQPEGIAVNDEMIVWADSTDGVILGLAKPPR